jgi:AraC-like DNA-binding protein
MHVRLIALAVTRRLEEPDISPGRAAWLASSHERRQSTGMDATLWLSRFVENVRVVDDRPDQITRLPDGRTKLTLRVLDGANTGDLTVSGPRTRALFKTVHGVARWIMIGLKPGWSTQVLGVPAHVLTDRIVHLHDIWGSAGADLCTELLAARSVPEVLDRLSHAMAPRAEHIVESASPRLARRAVRMLENEEVRIDSVAKRLGVTPRHLRRVFTESVGVGPKAFARTVRLRRAVQQASTSTDWGRIAVDTGYYDQAHLIADFRDLVGLTPGAFAKRIV